MNKVIVTMICIIVVIGAIFTAVIITKPSEEEQQENYIVTQIAKEEILDECTDEYEVMQDTSLLETDSNEEKISPNSSLTQKKYYNGCGHTTRLYLKMPEGLVNKTKSQLQEIYSDWNIETFTSNEIVLFQNIDGECGEHYVVKDKNGKVTIYKVTEDGEEVEFEQTQITTEYLPETDKVNMKNGISVNGREELNQLIEDFE